MEDFNFYNPTELLTHYVLISVNSGFLLVFEPSDTYVDISTQITNNNTAVIKNELAYWSRHFNIPITELVSLKPLPDHPADFINKYVDFVVNRNLPMVSFYALQYFHKDNVKRAKILGINSLILMACVIAWSVFGGIIFLLLSGVVLVLLFPNSRQLAHNTKNIDLVAKDIKVFEEHTGLSTDDLKHNDRSILERRYIKK